MALRRLPVANTSVSRNVDTGPLSKLPFVQRSGPTVRDLIQLSNVFPIVYTTIPTLSAKSNIREYPKSGIFGSKIVS
jgi:hypothetical protein